VRLLKGDRVVHPAFPEWGPGEVVEIVDDVHGQMAHVFFTAAGARTIERLGLVRVVGPPGREFAGHTPIGAWVEAWLSRHPGGFADRGYALGERLQLLDAARRASVFLAPATLQEALADGRQAAICSAAGEVARSSGMVPREDAAALTELPDRDARLVARALHDVLHGDGPYPARFDAFASSLDDVGAGSWPLATALPMLASPAEHVVIEPAPLTRLADALAFDLLWRGEPNWDTYGRALSFAHYLQDVLAPLGPIDFLDIAAFIRS
jgi:hypothetical protein